MPKIMKSSADQHHYTISSTTGRWTLLSTILASSMAFIDSTALNVILPSLQRDLQADATQLFWVLNSYLLMLGALIVLGGSLGDKRGRVLIFRIGIGLFSIGSVLCGLASTVQWLIIFRGIQGIGGALMIPGSLSIISATFVPEEKGRAIGIWSASTTIVTICGPILGGALADMGLWRWIFFINVPLGLLTLMVLQHKVPESRDSSDSVVDWLGAVVFTIALGLLTWGLLEIPDWGWNGVRTSLPIVLGILGLVAFVLIEKRVTHPMIDMALFRERTFSAVNLLSFFLYAALGGAILFLSLNLVQIQGYTQLQAGLTFLPFSFLMVLLASRAGRLTDRYGPKNFLIFGPTITGAGFLFLSTIELTNGAEDYWTTFFPGIMIFAFGMAITVVPLTTSVMKAVKENQSGIASGINNSVTRVASTFMNAIGGALAIYLFLFYVKRALQPLNLDETGLGAIRLEAKKLGDASVPSVIPEIVHSTVADIYEIGFLNVYSIIMMFCAALAFLSALIAVFGLKNSNKPT